MKSIYTFVLAFFLILTTGCSYQYTMHIARATLSDIGLQQRHEYIRSSNWVIPSSTPIMLVRVSSNDQTLPRTTSKLNSILDSEFNRYFTDLHITSNQNVSELFYPSTLGCELVVVARLISVENNLDAINEIQQGRAQHPSRAYGRDKLTLQFLIYDAKTNKQIDQIHLNSLAAWFKSDDEIPLDLIEGAVQTLLVDITANARGAPHT